MESSLEAVRFLASSTNRVQVLTALVDRKATRRELQEEVDCSRSTVARILNEAQSREWVDSEGSRYWLTPLGEAMVTDFRSYVETVDAYQHLGELVNHLPPPVFSLDVRHLRDAEVVEVTAENPAAPFTRSLELFRDASEYRGLNNAGLPDHVRVLRDRVEAGHLEFTQVLESDFIETIRADPDRTAVWTALEDSVRVYDGVVPINLHIVDGMVLVWLGENRSEVVGLLVSESPAVLSWAESLYEEYRAGAEPLGELE
jgi:predicted transcriptional regulator